jgi:hypothetical protein
MSRKLRDAPTMAAGWPDLEDELGNWEEAGQLATLWWRDDDAVAPSIELDRLVSIAKNVPIALAIIPATAEPELAQWHASLARSSALPNLAVLQHGWRHRDHSGGGKKSEFPAQRRGEDVVSDLAAGRARLKALFGVRASPILVPPWNRFDDSFFPMLGRCGLSAISRSKPRRAARPVPHVFEVNVHVDLVAWAGSCAFIGEGAALGGIVEHLRARRLGGVAEEPTGILTHHLVQDRATDAFLRRLVEVTSAHAAARWLDPAEVFAPAMLVPA